MKVGQRGRIGHLARRSFSALFRRRVSAPDDAWAREWMSDAEQRLFDRLSASDRAHSIRVARRVDEALADDPDRVTVETTPPVVVAAALLHDVGKAEARLGLYGRIVATVCSWFADDELAAAWASRGGITRRIGLYLRYPELGATSLLLAGSDPLVVAWSREHHDPPEAWTVPPAVGRVLVAADY